MLVLLSTCPSVLLYLSDARLLSDGCHGLRAGRRRAEVKRSAGWWAFSPCGLPEGQEEGHCRVWPSEEDREEHHR
jgi:hypothetical protein